MADLGSRATKETMKFVAASNEDNDKKSNIQIERNGPETWDLRPEITVDGRMVDPILPHMRN